MQGFPMGRSAGPCFTEDCRSSDGFLQIQVIVGDRECYASSSESDQSIERPVGSHNVTHKYRKELDF